MARGTEPVTCTRFRRGDMTVETVALGLCFAINYLNIIIQPFNLATRTSVFPPLCRRFFTISIERFVALTDHLSVEWSS
jgi:hypothetical protein